MRAFLSLDPGPPAYRTPPTPMHQQWRNWDSTLDMGQVHFSQGMCDHFLFSSLFQIPSGWFPPCLHPSSSTKASGSLSLCFYHFRCSSFAGTATWNAWCCASISLRWRTAPPRSWSTQSKKKNLVSSHLTFLPPSYTVEPASHKSSTLSPCLKLEWGKSFLELAWR